MNQIQSLRLSIPAVDRKIERWKKGLKSDQQIDWTKLEVLLQKRVDLLRRLDRNAHQIIKEIELEV